MKILLSCIFLFFYSCSVYGYEFQFGSVEIPEDFEGPHQGDQGESFKVTAFSRPHSDGTSSVMQISIWDPGQKLPLSNKQDFEQASSYYLLEFLSGIQRSSANFNHTEIEIISISDMVTAKVKWTGTKFGREMHGTMYCFIHSSKVVQLHTQDFVEHNGKYVALVESAFESINAEK